MRWNLVVGTIAVGLVPAIAGCCHPGRSAMLPVECRAQETDMWCWAACGEMIMEYKGRDVTQCDEAQKSSGRDDCPCDQCGTGRINDPMCANQGGWPQFGKYGFSWERTSLRPLSWDELTKELSPRRRCGASPVAFTHGHPGGAGHMYVAFGYHKQGGKRYVDVWDPAPECDARPEAHYKLMTYEEYVNGDDHWNDFYQIRKK